jgi:hypothetical protein
LDFYFTHESGERIYGETYTYYSEYQVEEINQITFVYTKEYDNDDSWDIIQKDYSLEKNIDFWYAEHMIGVGLIMLLCSGTAIASLIWGAKAVRASKRK